jgi:site-specific DNA-cytosine methylase
VRVLVACEFSGIVRDAFIARGHDAVSCDLLPSERPGPHIVGDVLEVIGGIPDTYQDWVYWDLMIAHPPCTHLSVSGARWFKDKQVAQGQALAFVRELLDAPIPRIAIENPVSIISSRIRKPDQIIQPWQFGHGEVKATCLWLKNLPKLVPTAIHPGREARVHRMPPGPNRWRERSRTFEGVADAMADQWGGPDLTLGLADYCARPSEGVPSPSVDTPQATRS